MLVTWHYRERDTIIQKLDPRARIVFMLAMMGAALFFWDFRFLIVLFAIGLAQYLLAKLTWQETRRAWLLIGFVAVVFSFITFLTGRGGFEFYTAEHLLGQVTFPTIPNVNWTLSIPISVERLMYAVSQLTRMFTVIILAITIPYTVDPSKYGVIFRGLGLPDKFAYAMDLAFRFIPTLGRDFSITLDAQRARGYEIEKPAGGVLAQIRKLAPLVVPITIGAIVGGEEIIDAMDLRCFGLRPRTWSQQLVYQHRDYLLIAASAIIFFGSAILSALGYGHFWVPDWLLALAR